MKYLRLFSGELALIDDEDFESLCNFKWYAEHRRTLVYAIRNEWIIGSGKARKHYLHRDVLKATKGSRVDHRDRNGLNCQKSNLRFATQRQNIQNKGYVSNKSGFKGVLRSATKKERWCVQITVNGITLCLGSFDTREEAAKVYDSAAILHFGEFACTNADLGLIPRT